MAAAAAMALRLLTREAGPSCSALVRRSMHTAASTSSITAALQQAQRPLAAVRPARHSADLGQRSFATGDPSARTYEDYTDAEIKEIEARVFGMHLGESTLLLWWVWLPTSGPCWESIQCLPLRARVVSW